MIYSRRNTHGLVIQFNYGGLFFGLFGILLSIYLYKKGIETKEPKCYYKTKRNISKLSGGKNSKIKIYYGNNEVSRIFTTYIWIWNNGRKPISKSDIPEHSTMKLYFQMKNSLQKY
jgi:hypothetical protein